MDSSSFGLYRPHKAVSKTRGAGPSDKAQHGLLLTSSEFQDETHAHNFNGWEIVPLCPHALIRSGAVEFHRPWIRSREVIAVQRASTGYRTGRTVPWLKPPSSMPSASTPRAQAAGMYRVPDEPARPPAESLPSWRSPSPCRHGWPVFSALLWSMAPGRTGYLPWPPQGVDSQCGSESSSQVDWIPDRLIRVYRTLPIARGRWPESLV